MTINPNEWHLVPDIIVPGLGQELYVKVCESPVDTMILLAPGNGAPDVSKEIILTVSEFNNLTSMVGDLSQ